MYIIKGRWFSARTDGCPFDNQSSFRFENRLNISHGNGVKADYYLIFYRRMEDVTIYRLKITN